MQQVNTLTSKQIALRDALRSLRNPSRKPCASAGLFSFGQGCYQVSAEVSVVNNWIIANHAGSKIVLENRPCRPYTVL